MAWGAIAAAALGGLGSFFGSKRDKITYTPNKEWLDMRKDVMGAVRTGVGEGGYTFDDATTANLKRSAVESAATPYAGAERRVVSSLAPYGNIGSMGRGLISLGTARAMDETNALRSVDINRAQNKLNSYNQLLSLGAGIQDPNLPQLQADMANQANVLPASARFGNALSTGAGVGLNLYQADQNMNFWNNYMNKGSNPVYSNYLPWNNNPPQMTYGRP